LYGERRWRCSRRLGLILNEGAYGMQDARRKMRDEKIIDVPSIMRDFVSQFRRKDSIGILPMVAR
jgi:hypothetical protein